MAAEVEGQVLLVEEDRRVVTVGPRLVELADGVVDTLDVRRVVLAVVEFVDLPGDVGLQRSVVVIQVRQGVFSHEIPSSLSIVGAKRDLRIV